jgi:type VI secretion system protein VasI
MKQSIIAFPIVFCGTLAQAQELPANLLACTAIPTESVRLICFDREIAAAREARSDDTAEPTEVASTAEVEAAPAAPVSKWSASVEKSAMTDDTNHFLSTTSTGYHQCGQFGSSGPISLWIRCLEDTTAIIISGNCHLASGFDGYGDVTWRTDDDKPVTRSFDASTDSQALGLWSGRQAIPAIKELFGKERLIVRFTPFGMSPVEATFDIAGLEESIDPLRQECGW